MEKIITESFHYYISFYVVVVSVSLNLDERSKKIVNKLQINGISNINTA